MNTNILKNFAKQYCNHYAGLNKTCWQMISLKFITSVLISIYYFLPIYFVNQLNINISLSGLIISAYGIGAIFGGPLGGKMSDKISPVLICIFSMMIEGITFICLIFLNSPPLLILNLFLLGTASYSLITSTYILTLSACQKNESERLKAINILETTSNLGLGLAALLIGTIETNNIQYVFLSAGVILILTSIFLTLNFSKLEITISHQKINSINNSFSTTANKSNTRQVLIFILLYLFMAGMIISQLSSTYSIYLNRSFPEYHFGGFGIAFALNTFLVVIFQTPLANYCGKHNYISIAGIGIFLLGLGMFLLAFSRSFYFVLLTCGIYTLGEIIFFSVSTLICYENATADKKGSTLGIYRMVYAASRIAGPISGSYIYSRFGSEYLWYCCGIIGLLCLISTISFKNKLSFLN